MDVRKLTRNRGWWRLFIVFVGLWYGGWAIGAGMFFADELSREGKGADSSILSMDALWEGLRKADAAGDTWAAKIIARRIEWREGKEVEGIPKPPEGFYSDEEMSAFRLYVNPFADLIPTPKPWYADSEFWVSAVVIVLFPWLVFFGFRMTRWIIEGFTEAQGYL